jgi:lipopolysaccharide assembly protein A
MRFLKSLLWALILVAFTIFCVKNWTPVTISLWGGLVMDTVLPLLLLISFLIGLVPTLILYRASRWSLNRKLESVQRSLTNATAPQTPSTPAAENSGAIPPVAAPIAVPPGVL